MTNRIDRTCSGELTDDEYKELLGSAAYELTERLFSDLVESANELVRKNIKRGTSQEDIFTIMATVLTAMLGQFLMGITDKEIRADALTHITRQIEQSIDRMETQEDK